MASRASSEVRAGIPALPRLGTSWYERGTRYRLARTRTTLAQLLIAGAVVFFCLGVYRGFAAALPPTARLVADGVEIAASCATLARGWVVQRRDHRKALLAPPTPEETWAAKRAHNRRALRSAGSGRGLLILAAPLLPALAAYYVGWTAAWLTVREYPSEAGARRWLAENRDR
ncbi:hypothetical protein ACVNF4_12470 [Streptomyces sp. S6]